MSKKQLDASGMVNELRGQSLFFQPTIEKPEPEPDKAVSNPLPEEDDAGVYAQLPSTSNQEPITSVVQKSNTTEVQQSGSAAVQEYRTTAVQHSPQPSLDDLGDYPLLDYRQLKKVDVRLTWEQKEYLDGLEALIARNAPGLEKNNPLSKRITRSAVIRALVEIARRLSLSADPSHLMNERDLLKALVEEFKKKLAPPPKK
jgi:hypothetical protein